MTFCAYYDQSACHSCSLLSMSYSDQLVHKKKVVSDKIGREFLISSSPEQFFRARAKLAVSESAGRYTFGFWDREQRFHDIKDCALHLKSIRNLLNDVCQLLVPGELPSYNVPKKSGEFKYLLVYANKDETETLVRFVLRTTKKLNYLKAIIPEIMAANSAVKVISTNLLSEHKAAFEGDEEIGLTDQTWIQENYNGLGFFIAAHSFFQTNPFVSEKLYAKVESWLKQEKQLRVLDLFCGMGGFALHAARAGHQVWGIELSQASIDMAKAANTKNNLAVHFKTGDAGNGLIWEKNCNVIIVNPPRRGLGEEMCKSILAYAPEMLIYSSCNVNTLQSDLAILGADYQIEDGEIFDMFPHTEHLEVLVQLKRKKYGS